jgi:hypothetical protein
MPQQTDEVFEDPFFASLYDHFNAWDVCDDFYLELALQTGGSVLDLGCGTGLLACRLAQKGLAVTGADPADGMLQVARSRAGAERVSWIKAEGQTLRLPRRFDLIYMTGHAFQALLADDDAIADGSSPRQTTAGSRSFSMRRPTRILGSSTSPITIGFWTPTRRSSATAAYALSIWIILRGCSPRQTWRR